jgi:DNA-directed RNA polymerase subunit H (RpoH/RPB5)
MSCFDIFCRARNLLPVRLLTSDDADEVCHTTIPASFYAAFHSGSVLTILPHSLATHLTVYVATNAEGGTVLIYTKRVLADMCPMGKADIRRLLARLPVSQDGTTILIYFFLPMSSQAAVLSGESGVTSVCPTTYMFEKSVSFLSPRYRVVPEEEVVVMLAHKCLQSVGQLPKMLRSDAMAKFIGLNVGQVVMSLSSSQYRVVV